jgi:hypothetical protein
MGEMLLEKLYKLGLVSGDDYGRMRSYVERHVEGAHPGSLNYWQEVIYDLYYGRSS